MTKTRKVCIIIPSLEPNEKLILLLEDLHFQLLKQENTQIDATIVLVDDGSGQHYDPIFQQAKSRYNCILLRHAINLGKGRALKTAFNYFLNELPGYHGVITVDADGQHSPADIVRCIKELSDGSSLILGCRNFDSRNVPLRSLIGNKLTRNVFRFLCGFSVSDTQTGLRAIPTEFIKTMLSIPGERFEYEMNMLIECGSRNINIKEVEIETIYSENNKGTHFNPLTDSIRVYKTFTKYLLSALSAFVLDIVLFTTIISAARNAFQSYILLATIIARIASSLYNYFINKKVVFSENKEKNTMLKYYLLAIIQMLVSGLMTTLLFGIMPFSETPSKIIIDSILFFASFLIQREWVFAKKR